MKIEDLTYMYSSSLSFLCYLAGVSCAGLSNVTVVDSFTTRHPSQLVLPPSHGQGLGEKHRLRYAVSEVVISVGGKRWFTLQSLQQSPLLHMALWVRVHFLQQLAPFLAHS